MEIKTILIIALILFIWYSYNNPAEGKQLIDNGIDKTQNLINTAKNNLQGTQCSSDYDPVCADGVTYDNSCYAQKAGKNNVTAGEC